MGLFNYYSIDVALRKMPSSKVPDWRIPNQQIAEIQDFFAAYTAGNDRLVVIPRFNGNYISFRYCGLEVLRLSKTGDYSVKIEERRGQIRGSQKIIVLSSLSKLHPLLKKIRRFLCDCIERFPGSFKADKQQRFIPGFSLEHWLESLVLADNDVGAKARRRLGLSHDLKQVASQVPVILKPKSGGKKKRHHHIDLLGFNGDKIVVVELKKDAAISKAVSELTEYTDWILGNGRGFDDARGKMVAMMDEGYLPYHVLDRVNVNQVRAVAVIAGSVKAPAMLENGVKLEVFRLVDNWLKPGGDILL